jgi:hypothetical protein
VEGRVQEIVQVEDPPEGATTGFARPDWRIFSDLATVLGCHSMIYKAPLDVFKDIRRDNPNFPPGTNRRPRRMTPIEGPAPETRGNGKPAKGGFLLVALPGGYRHRGIDLSSKVGGLAELGLEEGFRMHPEDLNTLGIEAGEEISVTPDGGKAVVSGPVRADGECPKGIVAFTRPAVFGGLGHRRGLWPLYRPDSNPVRADVTRRKRT